TSPNAIESFSFWNTPGSFIVGVSTVDSEGVEARTPYRLTVYSTDPPRSGLTVDALVAMSAGFRVPDPSEFGAADRNGDGVIDSGDAVRQGASPAPVQTPASHAPP
ncbi:hypothetical protein HZA57_03290, partial [Candidatus Poribacteria bacterium]|nr:hypothetical protein [Candidatus Poribacteria bacterium]